MSTSSRAQPTKWIKELEHLGLPPTSDREIACMVLPDLDYEAQLIAVRQLLQRHRHADEAIADEIRLLEERTRQSVGLRYEHEVDEWVDRMRASVYQDAAHSMAAVGMLTPLVESIFYQSFHGLRREFFESVACPGSHTRWEQPAEDQWDCHFVWNRGKRTSNLVEGIFQLADAIGLSSYLPGDLKLILKALIEYRNKMFHWGFEWPVNERESLERRLAVAGWPSNWFTKATIDDKPWIFYLSDDFVQRCLTAIDLVLKGIGAYVRDTLLTRWEGS